jgi:hypothetical protein
MKLDCRQRERELTTVTEQRDRLAEFFAGAVYDIAGSQSPRHTKLLNKAGDALAAVEGKDS